MTRADLLLGDCLEVLQTLPDASVDSIVTDPPYGLSDHKPEEVLTCLSAWIAGEVYRPKGRGFMGNNWDAWVPGPEVWRECLRVLKPGGHLLAFAGTRSMDLMSMSVRLAGFELRDSIGYAHDGGGAPLMAWCFGSGFPKSLDVSKAIDKRGGHGAEMAAQIGDAIRAAREARGVSVTQADRLFCDGTTNWTWFEGRPAGQRPPTPDTFVKIVAAWPELATWAEAVAEAEREVVGSKDGNLLAIAPGQDNNRSATTLDITAPATETGRQWSGWGTSLKPAWEPVILARKPLIGTVAENVLRHGTGALNIDGCRVELNGDYKCKANGRPSQTGLPDNYDQANANQPDTVGRWPANVIHNGSDEVLAGFPITTSGGGDKHGRKPSSFCASTDWGSFKGTSAGGDTGSAARFFYCAKASKKDRGEGNVHPTVKPTDLMRYLCRLVTPPDGTVLDPFMGSGSTGKAAKMEGFSFIGIERDEGYFEIAKARVEAVEHNPQADLFAEACA